MAHKLYLEAVFANENDENVYVTVETFISLFVRQYVNAPSSIDIYLIAVNRKRIASDVSIQTNSFKFQRLSEQKFLETTIASNCNFPVMLNDSNVVIAGLCGVCRNIVKCSVIDDESATNIELLGFKGSSLLAPSETSTWTKFCEIDIMKCTKSILCQMDGLNDAMNVWHLPVEFAQFESHMQQPIRMHNIYKLARDLAKATNEPTSDDAIAEQLNDLSLDKKRGQSKQIPVKNLDLEHTFAEGQQITIADIVLYPSFHLMWTHLTRYGRQSLNTYLPITCYWMSNVLNAKKEKIDKCLASLAHQIQSKSIDASIDTFRIDTIENYSLYKNDSKRYKPRNRIFTNQQDIEVSMDKVSRLGLDISSKSPTQSCIDHFDWTSIPFDALPEGGQLPAKRLQRKRDQLESLAREVIGMARTGDRIVDFCSGAGHLGILLAHKLPHCIVYLLENKEESLTRAKVRVEQLQLTNVRLFQCNLDYFTGPFEIGVSLHACGVATDIVLMHCLNRKARFVCCPCCYGGCHQMPHITYPRSECFRQHDITAQDFMYIAHCADQAHDLTKTDNAAKSVQGQLCMDIVDTDRKLYAEECGYTVTLSRLQPEDCTPKNRLLVGSLLV